MRKVVLVGLALAVGCGGNSFTAAVGTESGGASSGGASDAGGDGSASEAGVGSIGGVNSAGASGRLGHGGHAGSTGRAGGGGIGGQSGTATGGAGSGGAGSGNAGSGNAGSGNAGSGNAGSGGGVGPTCSQLYSRANAQLVAARACDKSLNTQQCTGRVATTCGCEVPVEKNESAETKAYLATVNEIHQKMCQQACPLIPCVAVSGPECNVPSGSGTVGECIDTPP